MAFSPPAGPLCFGGSFNPIHHAHLLCARAVAEAAGFTKVILIPTRYPPHKAQTADIAPPEHRLAMCRLATTGSSLFDVDDLELRRPGPSYTISTARELRARGLPQINWLIGADMLRILPQWREPDALLREVNFILMARPNWSFDFDSLPPAYHHLQHNVVTAPLIDITATDIRHRIATGKPIDYLTPPAVVDYINRHRLFASK